MLNPFHELPDETIANRLETFFSQAILSLLLRDFIDRKPDPGRFFDDFMDSFRRMSVAKLDTELGLFIGARNAENRGKEKNGERELFFANTIGGFRERYLEALEQFITQQTIFYENAGTLTQPVYATRPAPKTPDQPTGA